MEEAKGKEKEEIPAHWSKFLGLLSVSFDDVRNTTDGSIDDLLKPWVDDEKITAIERVQISSYWKNLRDSPPERLKLSDIVPAEPSLPPSPLSCGQVLDRRKEAKKLWEHMVAIRKSIPKLDASQEKPFVIISGNLSGMGKTTFGQNALPLLERLFEGDDSEQPLDILFDGHNNHDVIRRSLYLFVNCNNGDLGDNISKNDDDFENPLDWIAFRLLARGMFRSPALPLRNSHLKGRKGPLSFEKESVLSDVVRKVVECHRPKSKEPFVLFVHFDEYTFLRDRVRESWQRKRAKGNVGEEGVDMGEKFVKEVLELLASLTLQLWKEHSCLLVVLVTATVEAGGLLHLSKMRPRSLPLALLSPDVVLENLQQTFPSHQLFSNYGKDEGVRQWWRVLLHDLGVVPVFLATIREKLNRPTDRESLKRALFDASRTRIPPLSPKGTKKFLEYAVSGQEVHLDEEVDRQILCDFQGLEKEVIVTFRGLSEDGTLLFVPGNRLDYISVQLPLLLMDAMLRSLPSMSQFYTPLCNFSSEYVGLPFEALVLSTLALRLSLLKPRTLGELFQGVQALHWEKTKKKSKIGPQNPSCTLCDTSIWNNHLPLDPQLCVKINHDLFNCDPLTMTNAVPYKAKNGEMGIDASSRYDNILVLMQIKSSSSVSNASKVGKTQFQKALGVLAKAKAQFSQLRVVLVFITQQTIPSTLFPDAHPEDVYYIPNENLDKFSFPAFQHRFQLTKIGSETK